MEHDILKEIVAYLVCTAVTGILAWIGKSASSLVKNIATLNKKMERVLEKIASHEQRIARLEGKEYQGETTSF